MPFFDLPLAELQRYQPEPNPPDDLDAFWQETLRATEAHPLDAVFEPHDALLPHVAVYDVTFSGYGGQRVKGWYLRPAGVTGPLPCIVEYIGYGGGRRYPHNWLTWPAAGYAHLVMDTRGQGSTWGVGATPDLPDGANPHIPGFMTQGITSPHTYYYRRLYTDAVRAIQAARTRPDVDDSRIAVTGASQGGGLSIAAAALAPDSVALCLPDVPFLCNFRRAIGLTDSDPYHEIVRWLRVHHDQTETAYNTLRYFDGLNLAPRIRARSLFSTALMDTVCPPSAVFATYNALPEASKAGIRVYDFNQHEGGGSRHMLEKLRFVREAFPG